MNAHAIEGKWLDDLNADLSGSDRSCAVLAGAILDDRLCQLINLYPLPPSKRGEDRILGRGGIAESFSSRIELARRLSLTTESMAKALDWVRELRNDAAHSINFAFDTDSARDKVENIVSTLRLRERASRFLEAPYTGIKGNFVASTVVLAAFLQIGASEVKRTEHHPVGALENFTFNVTGG